MFSIDKTLINPNMPVTVRFSSVLYEWLRNKADKEEISFNQMVLHLQTRRQLSFMLCSIRKSVRWNWRRN